MTRVEVRTERLRGMVALAATVFVLMFGLCFVGLSAPERRRLQEKEAELARVLEREAQWRSERAAAAVRFQALHDDPRFLEVMARDRLDVHRPGERVFRIERRSED